MLYLNSDNNFGSNVNFIGVLTFKMRMRVGIQKHLFQTYQKLSMKKVKLCMGG